MGKEISDKFKEDGEINKVSFQQQSTNYLQNLREQNQSVKDTNYRLARDALYSEKSPENKEK